MLALRSVPSCLFLAALALAPAPSPAEEVAAPPPASTAASRWVDAVAKQCSLTPEQRAKVAEFASAAQAEMDTWRKANSAALDAYQRERAETDKQALEDYRKAKVPDDATQAASFRKILPAMRKAFADVQPAVDGWAALRQKQEAALFALLTPDQQAALRAYAIYRGTAPPEGVFSGPTTSERLARLNEMCKDAARKWQDISAAGYEGAAARWAIVKNFEATADPVFPIVNAAAPLTASARPRAKRRDAVESNYSLLVRECNLTDAQRAAVKTKAEARDAAVAAWEKANIEKLLTLKWAAFAPDDQMTDRVVTQILEGDLRILRTEHYAGILDLLTTEQKLQWWAFQVYQETMARYDPAARLADEQADRVRLACETYCRDLLAAEGDDAALQRARAEAVQKMMLTIQAVVAEQRGRSP